MVAFDRDIIPDEHNVTSLVYQAERNHAVNHAEQLRSLAEGLADIDDSESKSSRDALAAAIDLIGATWSRSNLGYHSRVYYKGFKVPPPGDSWSAEWGASGMFGSSGNWVEMSADTVKAKILTEASHPDLKLLQQEASRIRTTVEDAKSEAESIFALVTTDTYLTSVQQTVSTIRMPSALELTQTFASRFGALMSRDPLVEMRIEMAPHQQLAAILAEISAPVEAAETLRTALTRAAAHLERVGKLPEAPAAGSKIFIGHGRSHDWRVLKDFIVDRAELEYDEFNRVPVAGVSTTSRLSEMLDHASIAFLVLTAEDERSDGSVSARQNVVHEVGLFQGRLGWDKAIVLLEEGCEEFSNIAGLGQLRFPRGNIQAKFEEVRQILEREGLL